MELDISVFFIPKIEKTYISSYLAENWFSLLEGENLEDDMRIMIAKRIRLSNKNALTTLENLLQWGISMQKEVTLKQDAVPVYTTVQTAVEVLAETAENKQILIKNEVGVDIECMGK
ncbi:MAG: hypothetical protein ACKVTZ_02300 [Bacteroidia bacterium]